MIATPARADAQVVIVGAGPGGSALAILLARAGINPVLIDAANFPRDKPCGEGLMPAGVSVLERVGLDMERFNAVRGVTYRVPHFGSAIGDFAQIKPGRAVRRIAFDASLAQLAAAERGVSAAFGCQVLGVESRDGKTLVRTTEGDLAARFVIGADGLRSTVSRSMGWSRPPRPPHRFALVGHVDAHGHGIDRIVVTLLDGCEVYTAPTGADELLIAVLGSKQGIRRSGERARDAYAARVGEAHPDLGRIDVRVRGAGPFAVRPSTVAKQGVFLLGDAGGFIDPLTGDGLTEALVSAACLAGILSSPAGEPCERYRRWERARWRRRSFVARLAMLLTGSRGRARRAISALQRRPATLNRLLEVNDGSRPLRSLKPADWAALAGI